MGQTNEVKPIIPKNLIPGPGSQSIVGRHYSQRQAFTMDGVFYDLETGDVIERAASVENFLRGNPWYRMATSEELLDFLTAGTEGGR